MAEVIIVGSALVLAVFLVILVLSSFRTTKRMEEVTVDSWEKLSECVESRFAQIQEIENAVRKAGLKKTDPLFESANRAKNALAKSYNNSDPEQGAKGESIFSTHVIPRVASLYSKSTRLQNSESFEDLIEDIGELDDKFRSRRNSFNDNVLRFNSRIESFPSSLTARVSKLESKEIFLLDDEDGVGYNYEMIGE